MSVATLVSTAMSMAASLTAIATMVSVGSMPSPAEADFLYVPPREPVSVADSGKDHARAVHETGMEKKDRASGLAPDNPEEVTKQTAEIGAHRRVTRRYAAAEPLAKSGSAGLWQVHAGEMLREVLDRWGRRAGVEMLFLTDHRYRLHEGRAFGGSFDQAARTLFAALSHLPLPHLSPANPRYGRNPDRRDRHHSRLFRLGLHCFAHVNPQKK